MSLKAEEFGICVEVLHMVKDAYEDEMNEALEKLLRYQNARVVVGFFEFGGHVFESILSRRNATKKFIYLGSDTVYFKFDGVFRVQPIRTTNETFYSRMTDFFYQRDAKLLPEDPSIREIYADKHNCSWNLSSEDNCHGYESDQALMKFSISHGAAERKYIRMYDVAYLYAKGIDKTIQNDCKSSNPVEDKKAVT